MYCNKKICKIVIQEIILFMQFLLAVGTEWLNTITDALVFIVFYLLLLPILFSLSLILERLRILNLYLSEKRTIKLMFTVNVNWVCFGHVLMTYILGTSMTVFTIQSLQIFFTILKMLQDRYLRNYLIQANLTCGWYRVARHNN